MRYRRAIEKLRILAEACDSTKNWPLDEPFLLAAYVFGEVLNGADPLECVEVAFVLNLPPEKVPWESHPHGTGWLVDVLRLDKGGIATGGALIPARWAITIFVRQSGSGRRADPMKPCCKRWPSAGSMTSCPWRHRRRPNKGR